MEESLDGRLLQLNKSLRKSSKKRLGRKQGLLYDWIEKLTADDQPLRAQIALKEGMLVVKEHLGNFKEISAEDAKDDILRILVLSVLDFSSLEFGQCASEYLSNTLVLSSRRALKPLVYMSMAVIKSGAPQDTRGDHFYDTIFEDIDACDSHALRWVCNTTAPMSTLVVTRIASSLHNLLFRSVASDAVLQKAAMGLLNLCRHHGASVGLGEEVHRCCVLTD